jgi:hypothetical protein
MGFPMDGNYIRQLSGNKWHQLANLTVAMHLNKFGGKLNLIHQHRYLNIQNM